MSEETLSSNLVSDLREHHQNWGSPTERQGYSETRMAFDCKLAADEIERLRAEIDHINRYWQQFDHYPKVSPDETKEPQLPFGTSDGDLRYWTGFIDAAKLLEMDGPDPVWRMAESYKASIDLHHQRNAEKTECSHVGSWTVLACVACGTILETSDGLTEAGKASLKTGAYRDATGELVLPAEKASGEHEYPICKQAGGCAFFPSCACGHALKAGVTREPWKCKCGQLNSDWAMECGRCERQPPNGEGSQK